MKRLLAGQGLSATTVRKAAVAQAAGNTERVANRLNAALARNRMRTSQHRA